LSADYELWLKNYGGSVKIMLMGPAGAGKSSLVCTFHSTTNMNGKFSEIAMFGLGEESVTKTLEHYSFEKLKSVTMIDSTGWVTHIITRFESLLLREKSMAGHL